MKNQECYRTVAGMINYSLFALGPAGIAILLLNTVGARKMTKMMNDVLSSADGTSLSSLQVEYRAIVISINRTSKLFSILIILAIVGGVGAFMVFFADPTCLSYTPGLWNKPIFWWYDFLFSFVFPFIQLSA